MKWSDRQTDRQTYASDEAGAEGCLLSVHFQDGLADKCVEMRRAGHLLQLVQRKPAFQSEEEDWEVWSSEGCSVVII